MSRPPGPPPYTANQIANLSTPTEKFIAHAELNSYVVGHKLADLREKGLLTSYRNYLKADSAVYVDDTNGSGGDFQPSHDDALSDSDVNSHQGSLVARPPGPVRSNNWRGGARNRGAGRGYGGYHPYAHSQSARVRFTNRTIVNTASMVESSHEPQFASASGSRVNPRSKQRSGPIKSKNLCPAFTSTGKCARLRCPDIHDTEKLALCKLYLYKDECTKGALCHLSHQPTPNNTPHCLYYRDGRCTNSPCIFAHVAVHEAAPVCGAFGRLGYCGNGAQCTHLHVYECPGFANEGVCAAGDRCPLRHVHHASRMKAAARLSSDIGSPPSVPDTAPVEHSTNGTDSPSELHAITQQHDFVAFDLED